MWSDHLPGGQFHNPSESMRIAMANVPTTNDNAERMFGLVDNFLITIPNASLHTVSAMSTWALQKTGRWLRLLDKRAGVQAVHDLMEFARERGQAVFQQTKEREDEALAQKQKDAAEKAEQEMQKQAKSAAKFNELAANKTVTLESGKFAKLWQSHRKKNAANQREFLSAQREFLSRVVGIDKSRLPTFSVQGVKATLSSVADRLQNLLNELTPEEKANRVKPPVSLCSPPFAKARSRSRCSNGMPEHQARCWLQPKPWMSDRMTRMLRWTAATTAAMRNRTALTERKRSERSSQRGIEARSALVTILMPMLTCKTSIEIARMENSVLSESRPAREWLNSSSSTRFQFQLQFGL